MEGICPHHCLMPVWFSDGSSTESELPVTNGDSHKRERARGRGEVDKERQRQMEGEKERAGPN